MDDMTATTGADWGLRAACRDATNPDQLTDPSCEKAAKLTAAKFCRRCPVQSECATARQGSSGIWAGQWFKFLRTGRVDRPVNLLDGAL